MGWHQGLLLVVPVSIVRREAPGSSGASCFMNSGTDNMKVDLPPSDCHFHRSGRQCPALPEGEPTGLIGAGGPTTLFGTGTGTAPPYAIIPLLEPV